MRSVGTSELRRAARTRVVAVLLVAVTSLVAAGCGLRLETPPPPPLVPGAVEQVRQRTTADALAIQVLAQEAARQSADDGLRAALGAVEDTSRQHLDALGGIYDPGPVVVDGADEAGTAGPSGTPGATPGTTAAEGAGEPSTPDAVGGETVTVTAADLVTLLTDTAASAGADAAATADGPLARLLCAVAVSRSLAADALRVVAALPPPDPASVPAIAFQVPDTLPEGITSEQVRALVQSEDAIAMAWEVAAARSADDARAQAAERGRVHRERAEAWADAAAILATGIDPRRSAYDLPGAFTAAAPDPAATAAALAALEGELAVDYTSLVASAAPGARSVFVDAALDAARAQVRAGGVPTAFPGMPERTP